MANQTSGKSGGFLEDLLLNGQLAWYLFKDPRVSFMLKAVIPLIAVIYFIMPVDLLPDFIPIIGQLDEVALVLLLIRMFVALAPSDVVEGYRQQAGGPKGSGTEASGKSTASAGSASANGARAKSAEDVVDADYRVVNE